MSSFMINLSIIIVSLTGACLSLIWYWMCKDKASLRKAWEEDLKAYEDELNEAITNQPKNLAEHLRLKSECDRLRKLLKR